MALQQLDFNPLFNKLDKAARLSGGKTPEPASCLPPLIYCRSDRARRYRLFVDRDGRPRVTIPRRGSEAEARRFAAKHTQWLIEQIKRFEARRKGIWQPGTEILFRGEPARLQALLEGGLWRIHLGAESFVAASLPTDFRPMVEAHLLDLARRELPHRVAELADLHPCRVSRTIVRNQRSRWGSCSRSGTISLNWRLLQASFEVRDYLIIHELMHLREMNHSPRFWALVREACPGYRDAELWLRKHGAALL